MMQASGTSNTTPPSATGQVGPLRVFLVDDHTIVREGLRTLISAEQDMTILGEAGDGEEAWRTLRSLRTAEGAGSISPTIVIMDISMPHWNGVETTSRIQRSWPDIKILALSMHEDRSYMRSLLEAGAVGYVLKRSAAQELIRAIRLVAQGKRFIDNALPENTIRPLTRPVIGVATPPSVPHTATHGSFLSEREDAVLRLIAQGFTNKEVAAQLGISVKTVETYKSRSMEKLHLASRADIVRHALSKGWLN